MGIHIEDEDMATSGTSCSTSETPRLSTSLIPSPTTSETSCLTLSETPRSSTSGTSCQSTSETPRPSTSTIPCPSSSETPPSTSTIPCPSSSETPPSTSRASPSTATETPYRSTPRRSERWVGKNVPQYKQPLTGVKDLDARIKRAARTQRARENRDEFIILLKDKIKKLEVNDENA